MTRRTGVTLVELLVVLVILAIATAVSSVALRRMDAPPPRTPAERLHALRTAAIRAGAERTETIRIGDTTRVVTALPDGRTQTSVTQSARPITSQHDEPAP